MSQETEQWLNNNVLIGYEEKRGHAWHYRQSAQGVEPNHYVGPVPVADVERRLFHWEPELVPFTVKGKKQTYSDPKRVVICRPDTGAIFEAFTTGYQVHGYRETLLEGTRHIINDDLNIGSAGLLREGAVAWVQVETEASWFAPGGVEFRPFLFAATSMNGAMSSTWGVGNQLVVCDNTLAAAASEAGGLRIKIKHSSGSLAKIKDVGQALGIIHSVGKDFEAEVANLLKQKVPEKRFMSWANAYAEVTAEKEEKGGRGLMMATNKRDALINLWSNDERVTPWKGTAWGVLQTASTYEHHVAGTKGAGHAERNMGRMLKDPRSSGSVVSLNAHALDLLVTVS